MSEETQKVLLLGLLFLILRCGNGTNWFQSNPNIIKVALKIY